VEQAAIEQSTIGPANRLLADGRYRYEYDAVGNLVKQVSLAEAADPGAVRIFAYDHLNRMVRVEVWSRDPGDPAQPAAGAVLESFAAYTYDAWGRRIARVADADGQGPAPAQRTAVAYEGVAAWAETVDGALTVRYLHGAGVDELWATADAAGAVAWRLTDRLQTVRDVIDADGGLIVRREYTAFGEPLPDAAPQEADAVGGARFAFVGREWDEVAQAYFYRTRMYAPQAGRFTTVDGLGFEAGDFHLYRYVHNQPNHLVDPFGEAVFSERQAMKRIQLAMHQMVKCLGEVARDQFDTVGLYVLITNVAARGAGGGLANLYAGKSTNIDQRLKQHAATGVGGRGLKILASINIKLPRRIVENPQLLSIAEQILIEAFGGKESLHNTINAKRGLPC
jgi:RHS repeat-associated protein